MPSCSSYHFASASGSLARKKTPPIPVTFISPPPWLLAYLPQSSIPNRCLGSSKTIASEHAAYHHCMRWLVINLGSASLSVALEGGADETKLRKADILADDVFHWSERGEPDLGKGVGDATVVIVGHQVVQVNRFAFLDQLAEMGNDGILRQL